MCGRARLSSDVSEIRLVFSIPPHRPSPNIAPSWNVAPTDPVPIVRYDAKASERSLDVMRWGLVPFWAKDLKVGFSNINAKAEGIEGKPAFREAFQRRRCLVPVDNFYKWDKKVASGKQPYAIAPADRGLMALAGLWENWRSPAGEWVRSFAIITTTPNELCVELHNRMPVVLGPEVWPVWLGEEPELGFGLGIAAEQQLAAVGGRQMHVDHLHGGKLFQHTARRQPGRQRMQAPRERDVQAICQESNEDMRLDTASSR
jgi:putative SOS response-associated peptidase YedK